MCPVESSIDTVCGPLAWRSISMRPRHGQQVGDLAMDQVAAIELGRDLHRQAELAPGRLHPSGVRHGAHEVAAEADERLAPARR